MSIVSMFADLVPADWLPDASMTRIITHWTAGAHKPNKIDLAHYHILIDDKGGLHRGNHSISANAAPAKEPRASHTLNCNTGSIGIAVCCNFLPEGVTDLKSTKYPFTWEQWNMLAFVAGVLARKYKIPIDAQHILGHGEVEVNLGIKQKGKIDPLVLPWKPNLSYSQVGDLFRANVRIFSAEALAGAKFTNPNKPPPVWA
jgi:N-acetyl-anhydromuramyl-L-alanine amidase AmpD